MEADILALSPAMLNLIWIGLFIILLIIEVFTVGLTTIWFAIGALAAAGVNTLGADLIIQVIVFLAVSIVILMIFTRPWAAKAPQYQNRLRTNYESKIGEIIKITERVDNLKQTGTEHCGRAGMDGPLAQQTVKYWKQAELAKVVAVSGVKLIVEKYEEGTIMNCSIYQASEQYFS